MPVSTCDGLARPYILYTICGCVYVCVLVRAHAEGRMYVNMYCLHGKRYDVHNHTAVIIVKLLTLASIYISKRLI